MLYEVTIGIPVYNAEKYIRQALDSALAQTFKSIEFLVLDDCGTDKSMEIVREYQQVHPRCKDIHVVRQPYNMGIGEARNRIVNEALGHYLYFMDADDMITVNAIELLYKKAKRYNAEIVCGSHERVELLDEEVKRIKDQYCEKEFFRENEFAFWTFQKYDNLHAMIWNILIDINVYRRNQLKHLPINYWEDFVFTIDLPTYVNRAVLLSDITYYYHCRYGSLSNFNMRNHIEKSEVLSTIDAMDKLKNNSNRLKHKPYFHMRMYKVMITHFYIVCSIIRNSKTIFPPFTKRELCDVMRSPLSFIETITLKGWRLRNFALYLLGVLPATISIWIIEIVGRKKGLI